MEINKKLLEIFRYTFFRFIFEYHIGNSSCFEMSELLHNKKIILRNFIGYDFIGMKPDIIAKVFIKQDTNIIKKEMIKSLSMYSNNIINIYNLYLLSREYMRVNK